MILIIDNYDSFTYNLSQSLGSLGLDVLVWRNDTFTVDDLEKLALQAVVISPGPGFPSTAGQTMPAVGFFKDRLPLLGVCLGHQAIVAYFGGKIVRAPRIMHGKISLVYHNGDGIFQGIDSPFEAMRYHSLLAERDSLPRSLEVIAWTAEGEIMGVRHRTYRRVIGLQFHPESWFTPAGGQIIANFCRLFNHPAGEKIENTYRR